MRRSTWCCVSLESLLGSGDQIALKDGKHLLVVRYIWRGPFRASAMRRTKMAADPAASDGIFFRRCEGDAPVPGAHHYIHLSQQPTVVNAIPEVVQASRGGTTASTVPPRDRSRSVYRCVSL